MPIRARTVGACDVSGRDEGESEMDDEDERVIKTATESPLVPCSEATS